MNDFTKLVQAEHKSKFFLFLLRRRLIYSKLVQVEHKSKFFLFLLRRRLIYSKLVQVEHKSKFFLFLLRRRLVKSLRYCEPQARKKLYLPSVNEKDDSLQFTNYRLVSRRSFSFFSCGGADSASGAESSDTDSGASGALASSGRTGMPTRRQSWRQTSSECCS